MSLLGKVWPRTRQVLALLCAGLAIFVAYGGSIATAVDVLRHGYPPSAQHLSHAETVNIWRMGIMLIVTGLYLGFLACSLVACGAWKQWLVGFKAPLPGRGAGVFGAVLLLNAVGWFLLLLINPPAPPNDPVQSSLGQDLVDALVTAALGEELLVLALPIIIVKRAVPVMLTRPLGLVLFAIALTLLRLSYHLYQGAGALSHVLWAVGAIVLYLWSGRVWPQIAAHATYDVVVSLQHHAVISAFEQGVIVCTLSFLALGLGWVRRRPPRPRSVAAT